MDSALLRPMSEDYAGYLRDESRTVGRADYIAFPENETQVREVLRDCWEHDIPVTVQGGRTGVAAAAVPFGGCILNLSRMNRILGMRKENGGWLIRLQPGVPLSQLRKAVAGKNFDTTGWDEASREACAAFCREGDFFFSPDPTEPSATLGGMTACNASGARSYRYGPTRGQIHALRLVLADGRVLALRRGEKRAEGYKAVFSCEDGSTFTAPVPTYRMPRTKNASGYYAQRDMDLIDLIIGSDGTLGVMTELEVSLLPLPPVIWGVTFLFSEEGQALRFVAELRQTVPEAVSVEFFDEGALNILRRQREETTAFSALPEWEADVTTAVYVELHTDTDAQAEDQLLRLGDACAAAGGDPERSWAARGGSELERMLFFRHAVPESVNLLIDQRRRTEPAIAKLGADMSVPDEHLFDVIALYRRTLREEGLESAIWGHVGNNHLHVNVLPRNREDMQRTKGLFLRWAGEVTRMGGAVSAEHGVGKLKTDFLAVMYGEKHIGEMRALKRAFDSKGLLGVGNLFSPRSGPETEK